MSAPTTARPDWAGMRRQEFDLDEPLTLFDAPPPPLPAADPTAPTLFDQED